MALLYFVRGGHNNATFQSAKLNDSWPNYVDRFWQCFNCPYISQFLCVFLPPDRSLVRHFLLICEVLSALITWLVRCYAPLHTHKHTHSGLNNYNNNASVYCRDSCVNWIQGACFLCNSYHQNNFLHQFHKGNILANKYWKYKDSISHITEVIGIQRWQKVTWCSPSIKNRPYQGLVKVHYVWNYLKY